MARLSRRAEKMNSPAGPPTVGRGEVVEHELGADDRRGVETGGLGDQRGEPARAGGESEHRREVILAVEHQALVVDLAIEMDRELRHARHRTIDAHEVTDRAHHHRRGPARARRRRDRDRATS
jgi:hypothetical protein